MRVLSEIIDRLKGLQQTIYILGTGPTLRLFSPEFFLDKFTIGLNKAWQFFPANQSGPNLSITIHPNCIPPDLSESKTTWITKVKKSEKNWQLHEERCNLKQFYFFENDDNIELLKVPAIMTASSESLQNRSRLFCGRGIHTAAMHLAAILGGNAGRERAIILCGVDCASVGGDHHYLYDNIQPHQYNIDDVYREYYYYLVLCRELLERNYNVRFLSLSPLLGECMREEDYKRQLLKRGWQSFGPPKIIEENPRHTKIVKDYIDV